MGTDLNQSAFEPLVHLVFHDYFTKVVGPPGARGMPEDGVEVFPQPVEQVRDEELQSALDHALRGAGFRLSKEHRESVENQARFDFGTTTSISDSLNAIGGTAVALGALRASREIIVAWLKNRAARRMTLKLPDGVELSATGDRDFDQILEAIERYKARPRALDSGQK